MTELTFKKCYSEHLRLIAEQEVDRENKLMSLVPEYADALTSHFSLSAWRGSVCMGAAGIMPIHKHRGLAWALMSRHAGPHMLQITRKVKSGIDLTPFRRVEMTVDMGYDEGHRWARMLGFVSETPNGMKASGVMGNDEVMYARIKNKW